MKVENYAMNNSEIRNSQSSDSSVGRATDRQSGDVGSTPTRNSQIFHCIILYFYLNNVFIAIFFCMKSYIYKIKVYQ